MNRLFELQVKLLQEIGKIEKNEEVEACEAQEGKVRQRDESLDWERLHMGSCARCAWMLAQMRGADPELAACAAAVHDYGRILTGRQKGHAEAGYEPVKVFLKETALFTEGEIEIIATAVKNHSLKTETGTVIEEIVKDADVIDCYQYGLPFDRPEKEERYENWRKECGISEA